MVKKKKTPRIKIIIYSIIIIIMIVGNVVIYLQNSRPANIDTINLGLDLGQPVIRPSEPKDSSKQSVLEHNLFTALTKIGDWPVVPENVGKADPFAPFFND